MTCWSSVSAPFESGSDHAVSPPPSTSGRGSPRRTTAQSRKHGHQGRTVCPNPRCTRAEVSLRLDESDRQDTANGIAAGVERLNGMDLVAHRSQVAGWVIEYKRDHPDLGGLLPLAELDPKLVGDPGLGV